MITESLLVGNRFLHDASLVMIFGGSGFIELTSPELRFALDRIWICPERLAVSIAVATTIVTVPLNLASLTDSVPTTNLVATYLFQTNGGQVLVFQILGAAALLVVSIFLARTAKAVVAGLMLCELSLAGHATDGDTFHQIITASTQAVHILAGAAWLGALPVLVAVIICINCGVDRVGGNSALQKFSAIGHLLVALTLTCGLSTALLINGLPDIAKEYDRAVIAKGVLVSGMAIVALVNRYAVVPRLRSYPGANSLLVAGSTAEILLGMTALALVASFGITDPA